MVSRRFPAQVPEKVPRVVAFQVVALGLLALASDSVWPVAFLALDFALRALVTPRYSLLAVVAREVAPRLPGGPGLPILYQPKRFAATLGFAFFTASTVLYLVPGARMIGEVLAGMVVGLATLEAFAGVCVGCHIHALLVRFGVLKAPACESCGPVAIAARARVSGADRR